MKKFYTYEQQIDKLKSDGLNIIDEEQTIGELKLEGYYNIINGYAPFFKNEKSFVSNTTFEHINALFDFDKGLRNIVYNYTSTIERHIKALIAHEFSKVHGVDEKLYLTSSCFTQNANATTAVNKLILDCNQTITDATNKNSLKYREYIYHNYNQHGHVPLWILIRTLSFGTTSIFYKYMIEEERKAIADNYIITSNQLANMLEVVVAFRNIVAHGERTFCARLPRVRLTTQLNVLKSMSIKKNPHGENMYGRNDFLALLICCKYLLPPLEFSGLITEIDLLMENLSNKIPQVIFSKIKTQMGLKSNAWKLLPKLKI